MNLPACAAPDQTYIFHLNQDNADDCMREDFRLFDMPDGEWGAYGYCLDATDFIAAGSSGRGSLHFRD